MQSAGYNIKELNQEAQYRWLRPSEVLFILQNHENQKLTETPPQKPPSGSLLLFNKRVLRFFRKDGHSWRKKRDGRTVGEAHERLKVGNVEALNCYYAHGDVNPNFQRRCYWMLDPVYEHIVLVHYREINEARHRAGSNSLGSPGFSYSSSQSPSLSTIQHPGSSSVFNELHEPYHSSVSPGSVEVSSEVFNKNNGIDQLYAENGFKDLSCSPEVEVSQALRRLEEQLSLNDDDIAEIYPYYEQRKDLGVESFERTSYQDDFADHVRTPENSKSNSVVLQNSGDEQYFQHAGPKHTIESKDSPFWKETLELCSNSTSVNLENKNFNTSGRREKTFTSESGMVSAFRAEQPEKWTNQWVDMSQNNSEIINEYSSASENDYTQQLSAAKQFLLGSDDTFASPNSLSVSQDVENSAQLFGSGSHEVDPDYYKMWLNQESLIANSVGSELNSTFQKQKFRIREISPEHGYATDNTKVIITGDFLCDPPQSPWACMFGDVEVPVQIIQEGVLLCQAPPNIPGKVGMCITSGNREPCSEIKEFEYLVKPSSYGDFDLPGKETNKRTDEMLLLARFAQMLLSDSVVHTNHVESGINKEDIWEHIIEDLLVGTVSPSQTMDWIFQELLKDKMQQWISSKHHKGDTPNCSLSKKEQGIIHMVAGLGFEWALHPILESGVSIDFRDINGWTALHWAAHFGREKMVASLVASGASAQAVTDPTSQDTAGKSAGFIASSSGHKGLAGYLSELALTSHLSSLTLRESENSQGSAEVAAERTVESISLGSLGSTEDQLSLKDSLAAVRNATQAAARIQSAFRAHSFRRRQQKEFSTDWYDENGITQDGIHEIYASKLAFRNLRDHKLDKAALSIQKKYRGWKGRKDFLAMRQKVVRIQALVRGYQVRKKYKVILWAVGILDKVVLRWRRRGVGLRGYRPESECIVEGEDEDILKVFRKKKVDGAIEEAMSQVLSMVESPDARQQYRRMLESYRQAKEESSVKATESETGSISQINADMEAGDDDYLYMFQ